MFIVLLTIMRIFVISSFLSFFLYLCAQLGDPLFGAGQGVTMEVTTVSAWLVPSGATIEDLCAIARGTETMR